jgi:hypothetical protein
MIDERKVTCTVTLHDVTNALVHRYDVIVLK